MKTLKRFLLGILPLLLGSLVLWRWHEDSLVLYVASRYVWLVASGGGALVLLGLASFVYRHETRHVAHDIRWWQIGMVSIPVILGSLVAPAPLSAGTALQRGLAQTTPSFMDPVPFSFAVDSSQRSFSDWARIISATPDLSGYDGQEATISGFIAYNEDDMYLTRFQIACCAADARPIGIQIRTESRPEQDSWWEVSGVMNIQDDGTLRLDAVDMTEIDIPRNPYL